MQDSVPRLSPCAVPCSAEVGAADGFALPQRAAASSGGGFGLAVIQSLAQAV